MLKLGNLITLIGSGAMVLTPIFPNEIAPNSSKSKSLRDTPIDQNDTIGLFKKYVTDNSSNLINNYKTNKTTNIDVIQSDSDAGKTRTWTLFVPDD
jgi:hypothetical protein